VRPDFLCRYRALLQLIDGGVGEREIEKEREREKEREIRIVSSKST
jgi:hypothetical protein